MLRLSQHRRERPSPLARYSETLGELMLRRQTELAMAAAKAESDLANRAKAALLGTMSHELRTPLSAIIGFSDLIRTLEPGIDTVARSADYATHIAEAGRRLLEVVTEVLDYSKIESGALELDLDSCVIAELIADAVALVAPRLEAKRQRLEPRIERRIPKLDLDARRIRQILVNLLGNASRFTPEGGRILVTARATREGGAAIAVVDTGAGMTQEQIWVAMTPFGQVQSHLSRTHEGIGLGLPISRGLARRHGGDLYLESEPGAGTSAVLTLPPTGATRGGAKAPGGGERAAPRRAANSAAELHQ